MFIQTLGRTPITARVAATMISFAAMIGGCSDARMTSTAPVSASPIPASLEFVGGGQVVLTGQRLSNLAIVLDSAGRGVPGVIVTFTGAGSGSVQPPTRTTDANGMASTNWLSGSGENRLIASAPGLRSVGITSYGLDSSNAALYELVNVEPGYVVNLAGTLVLEKNSVAGSLTNGWFYTTVRCQAPATCADSGWGTYTVSASSLSLAYQNRFLQYWNEFSENQEIGTIRGDTIQVNQTDSMFSPFSFRLSFVFRGGTHQ